MHSVRAAKLGAVIYVLLMTPCNRQGVPHGVCNLQSTAGLLVPWASVQQMSASPQYSVCGKPHGIVLHGPLVPPLATKPKLRATQSSLHGCAVQGCWCEHGWQCPLCEPSPRYALQGSCPSHSSSCTASRRTFRAPRVSWGQCPRSWSTRTVSCSRRSSCCRRRRGSWG